MRGNRPFWVAPSPAPAYSRFKQSAYLQAPSFHDSGESPMTTINADLEHVLRRLEKLERQNRWLKGFGFALAVAGAVGLLAAAQPAQNKDKVAEFEKFVLRDQ